MRLRASVGTLSALGLKTINTDARCTTGYFLLGHGCSGKCSFCAQSRSASTRTDRLSRVTWPDIEPGSLVPKMEEVGALERICFQCMHYPGVVADLSELLSTFRGDLCYEGPISASLNPCGPADIERLQRSGLSTICFPLDLPTPELFESVKGTVPPEDGGIDPPGSFQEVVQALDSSLEVFCRGNVSTHLMVGMGESDLELVERMKWCRERGIRVALFAFCPVRGTPLADREPPTLGRYRAVQLAAFIIGNGISMADPMVFAKDGRITGFRLEGTDMDSGEEIRAASFLGGDCFRTSGCTGCNRPYYNERPGDIPYNYPSALSPDELDEAVRCLNGYLRTKLSVCHS